ncbi:hypothetical protein SAMN05444144_1028 [Flavobacterium akiainvivens]|nr:hypothetical protein SAMN05444144_1028 [Flavobacterium akiainvivens]
MALFFFLWAVRDHSRTLNSNFCVFQKHKMMHMVTFRDFMKWNFLTAYFH